MNKKTYKVLELDKIINILSEIAISPMGKEYVKKLEPSIFYDEVNKSLQETTEAVNLILKRGSLPLGGIKDIEEPIKRVNIGGILSIEELLDIRDFLYVSKKVNSYSVDNRDTDSYPNLQPYMDAIFLDNSLEKHISKCIKNATELNDNASEELFNIRQNIRRSNGRIKEKLNEIISSSTYKNMLQDNVITTRNGRYCVPIKLEYKNSFRGMIHDQSSTGATVFIEPSSIVDLNNKITELTSQEKYEIEKILTELSQRVNEISDLLLANLENLTYLDFVFAKGEFSIKCNCSRPKLNTKGYINIKKGRHPLLKADEVVPTDIYLGKNFTTLLISGPNTGGKTVSLKTLGLFTLMGQCGLHIPALDNSEIAIFTNVYADIGDEQSIEQSLSTFSSHMTNIIQIIKKLTENSLVILDELGAGTDPTEGAALAISILEYLHSKNTRVAVTTHYSELKVYAIDTNGVENASCEFDVNTLSPTYKLLIGIPGKSNAFSISKRLGLPDAIINDAKSILSQEDTKLEKVITDLEVNRKTVEREKEEAERMKVEIEFLKKDMANQIEKLEKQKSKAINEAKDEAKKIMSDAKSQADSLIQDLNRQINNKASMKDIEKTRDQLRINIKDLSTDLTDLTVANKTNKKLDKSIKKGDDVFITSMNSSGVVVSDIDNKNNVMVQIGKMKMNFHISNLVKERKKNNVPKGKYQSKGKIGKSTNIKAELDLRGLTVDEGLDLVDKYLDDAYLAHLNQVSIIHGKGTGVLRRAVRNFLRNNHNVAEYRYGEFGEGDMGVTIVTLK